MVPRQTPTLLSGRAGLTWVRGPRVTPFLTLFGGSHGLTGGLGVLHTIACSHPHPKRENNTNGQMFFPNPMP